MRSFIEALKEYGRGHPDFAAVLRKYNIEV